MLSKNYTLFFTDYFKKKFKKVINSKSLIKALEKSLIQLENDPFYLGLKTHKVISLKTNSTEFSSRVTGDIRIIWNFEGSKINIINLYDLGGHYGSNKVYK